MAAGFAFALVSAATKLVEGGPPETVQPTAVVWADRVFATRHQFDVWLTDRGASYETWASRHPGVAQRLDRTPRVASPSADPKRELAATKPASAPADKSTLAIGILVAATLGLFGLFAVVRMRPKLTLPRRLIPRRAPSSIVPRGLTRHPLRAVRENAFAFAGLVAQSAVAVRTDWGTRIEHRRRVDTPYLEEETPAPTGRRLAVRRTLRRARRWLPEIALYATGALLACVLGASIALYLN
jgi:hypothetical protein